MTGGGRPLVLFPGAGSFGSEFRALRSAAGPDSRVMRYPGRNGPDAGGPTSFETIVASCADQIARLPSGQAMLFGHSYGAYLAYATAVALGRRSVEVSLLMVAGASAPDLLRVPLEATGSPEAAAAYLDAVDPGRLTGAAPEWREAVAETVQQDLRVLATLALPSPPVRLSCPIVGLRGAGDPLTSDTSLAGWRRYTRRDFRGRTFEGGHSDLLGDPRLAALVQEELTREPDGRPSGHRTAGPSPR